MPTYVALLNWTEQGIKNFKDSTKRASDARETMKKAVQGMPVEGFVTGG